VSRRARELSARRAELAKRIAAQRAALGDAFDRVERKLAPVERGLRAVRWLGRHPWPLVVALGALVVLRPGLVGPFARGGLKVLSTFSRGWGLVSLLANRRPAREFDAGTGEA
jgi:hypothetical protein